MAILVPCLVTLREEFNELAPSRDTSTDGWIGDTSHQGGASDHNPDESGNTSYEDADNIDEVHAIDVDKDLNKSGWSMQKCVDIIVGRHKSGEDHRLQYVIFNRKIWSRSWGWTADDYSGSNPHDKHAHFSARYETENESDTSGWGLLEDDDMQLDDPLFPGDPSSSWEARYPSSEATVRNAMCFAAYDSYDTEKAIASVATAVAELTALVKDLADEVRNS